MFSETIAFLREQDVEMKVLSGDSPDDRGRDRPRRRDRGRDVERRASTSPRTPRSCGSSRSPTSVVGRISPEDKRAVV